MPLQILILAVSVALLKEQQISFYSLM